VIATIPVLDSDVSALCGDADGCDVRLITGVMNAGQYTGVNVAPRVFPYSLGYRNSNPAGHTVVTNNAGEVGSGVDGDSMPQQLVNRTVGFIPGPLGRPFECSLTDGLPRNTDVDPRQGPDVAAGFALSLWTTHNGSFPPLPSTPEVDCTLVLLD
jgi:hypothetical protein